MDLAHINLLVFVLPFYCWHIACCLLLSNANCCLFINCCWCCPCICCCTVVKLALCYCCFVIVVVVIAVVVVVVVRCCCCLFCYIWSFVKLETVSEQVISSSILNVSGSRGYFSDVLTLACWYKQTDRQSLLDLDNEILKQNETYPSPAMLIVEW